MFMANPRSFGRLSEEQRQIVTEEGTRAGQASRKGVRDKEEFYLSEMQKAGVAVTRPEVAPFRERMGPAYDQLRRALGDETWTAWTKLVETGRSS